MGSVLCVDVTSWKTSVTSVLTWEVKHALLTETHPNDPQRDSRDGYLYQHHLS